MKPFTASETGMTPPPSGTSRTTAAAAAAGRTDLESFFQPNATTEGKVDWENMSRGAFSTVSKMKSAVEKMSNHNSSNNNNNSSSTQPDRHGGRRHRSGQGTATGGGGDTNLGTFLKRGAAGAAVAGTTVPSDDRSRGAHSTMSHNLRRQRTQRPKRGIKDNASDHVSPFFHMPQWDRLPTRAERNLPTGNPKAQEKTMSSSSSFTGKQRSEKAQKNLELFMSRQQPIPKQDLEVRSAFTSVDRKRKNKRIVPATGAIPLPTNKEDLLQLLKAAATAPSTKTNTNKTTAATTTVTAKKSPKPGSNNNSNKKGGLEQQSASSVAPTLSQVSQSAHVKTHVGRSSPPGMPLSQSQKGGEPTRQIRRTISASSATGDNSTKKPLKRTKSSQKSTKGTAATTVGTVPQFSSLLPATTTHMDKPHPILATLSGSNSSGMQSGETSILRSLSATDIIGNISSVDASHKVLPKAQRSPTDNKNNENMTNQKITTRSLRKEVEGPRKKKAMASVNDRKGATTATTTTTTSQIMSARRLHHAPASSISQSPIAGRRQSLKMGLAGTASGEGPSRGAKTAVKRKKTKATAAATATPKKAAATIPTVPSMDHGPSSSDMGDASKATATKRNRPVIRRTDGPAGGEARRSIRGRRTIAKTEFEDVFTFYQWSESRQAESKIMAERQILRDAIMDGGPLHRAFNRIT